MRSDHFSILALGWLVVLPGVASAAGQGHQLAASCAACHRTDGQGSAIPSVAGQDEHRIAEKLLAYRSGLLSSQVMQVVAGALSPEEITAIAHDLATASPAERHP